MPRPQERRAAGQHRKKPVSDSPHGKFKPRRRRPAPPRVNFDQEGERLQKVLAAAGIASRRESETLIKEGRVDVDGQTVSELGTRVNPQTQEIRIDGQPLPRPKRVYYAVHKPTGVVCTARDPSGRTRVTDLLPPEVGRVFNVGRLDMASEGLILVTNDGQLANELTHPRHGVEKKYEVQVAGFPESDVLAQIRRGVHLAEGFARAVNVRVKSRRKNGAVLEMVLDEGRNREVRRLLARVGHKVQRLTRIAVGPIRLGDLPRGAVRKLTPEEVRKLRNFVCNSESKTRKPTSKTGRPAMPGKPGRRQKSAARTTGGGRRSHGGRR